jgi:hypothetical protein
VRSSGCVPPWRSWRQGTGMHVSGAGEGRSPGGRVHSGWDAGWVSPLGGDGVCKGPGLTHVATHVYILFCSPLSSLWSWP